MMNRFTHPSERILGGEARLPGRDRIAAHCRCYCFSSSKSKASSYTYDYRAAATDEARAVSGSSNVVATDDANIVQSHGGDVGSVRIQGNQGPVTITTSDPQVLSSALDFIAGVNTGAQQFVADIQASNKEELSTLIDALAANQEAQKEEQRNQTVLYVMLGLLALGGVVAWKKL